MNKEIGLTDKLDKNIFTVSRLNFEIKKGLEQGFANIWVEGEVSNYYCHNNRHFYFDLKDEYSKIKVVMFYESNKNLGFKIADGKHLILSGYVSVYEKRGEYQLVAVDAKEIGKGALLLAFEQLKEKLEKLGYFDISYKKPIPSFPKKIGAVTSTGGAVIKDMVSVLSERYDNFHLVVRNVNVQGPSSGEEICNAVDELCIWGVDVIIIARGGGSLEDLWAFNTEMVAEKIFLCQIPVISAVGHETDYTICDFVSDLRAATPSVAATLVIADKREVTNTITRFSGIINNLVLKKISGARKDLSSLSSRKVFRKPGASIIEKWQDYDLLSKRFSEKFSVLYKQKNEQLYSIRKLLTGKKITDKAAFNRMVIKNNIGRLTAGFKIKIEHLQNRINTLIKDLQANSPVSVIERGFSMVTDKNNKKIIKSISQVKIGDDINVLLKDGILFSKILDKISKSIKTG